MPIIILMLRHDANIFFISLKSVYIQCKVHIQFCACVYETMFRLEIQNEYG